MKVYTSLSSLPKFKNAVITIGSFDGVHQGHKRILGRLKALAEEVDGETVVITFHPHPRLVLLPDDHSLKLLNSIEEKSILIEDLGIDNLVIVPFTKLFAAQSPTTYIDEFLIKHFAPRHIVIGYDHKFGKGRQGDIELLKSHLANTEVEISEIPKQEVKKLAVSSTKVRNALNTGEVELAVKLLGHPYSILGTVIQGEKIGGTLGYHTANIAVDESHKLIPRLGIYAVEIYVKDKWYHGMLYIGDRPSISYISDLTIEVHIFDFDDDIYNEAIRVQVCKFIREDQKYDTLNELHDAIAEDEKNIRLYFDKD